MTDASDWPWAPATGPTPTSALYLRPFPIPGGDDMTTIHARTNAGADIAIPAGELQGRLRGPVLLPGEPAYEEARSLWNAMIDRRPAAIARCLGVADVAACVRFA